MDVDGTGLVCYNEFLAATVECLEFDVEEGDCDGEHGEGEGYSYGDASHADHAHKRGLINDRRLADAFDRLDLDHTGFITESNLQKVYGTDFSASILREADGDGDGHVSKAAFMAMMKTPGKTSPKNTPGASPGAGQCPSTGSA
jgi:hypothetical protein